jgi:parvulin-like peptidyl-prolyl isomerase
VASAAAALRLPPRAALTALAHDARAAAEAESRGLDGSALVQHERRAILVRAVLGQLKEENAGAPSLEELQALRRERWRDFDRPESARVIHAVAMGEGKGEARRVAEAILKATAGAKDAAEFEARAKEVPHEGVETRIETLPFMARDGRSLQGTFVVPFAGAALALKAPAEQSPVVATSFGYHVIFLIERAAAYRPTDGELAQIAREEVAARRTTAARLRLLEELRKGNEVLTARNAIEVTQLLDGKRADR